MSKQTNQSISVNAPINAVWNTINNFHKFDFAPNVITKCVAVGDKSGKEIGARRILNDAFHETLIECNEETHTIRYSIDDGPSPVAKSDVTNYIGQIMLSSNPTDNSTLIDWSSSWESESDDAVEFCSGIYKALLADTAKSIESMESQEK